MPGKKIETCLPYGSENLRFSEIEQLFEAKLSYEISIESLASEITPHTWCEALSSISPPWPALRATPEIPKFHMTSVHYLRFLRNQRIDSETLLI